MTKPFAKYHHSALHAFKNHTDYACAIERPESATPILQRILIVAVVCLAGIVSACVILQGV